METATAEKKQTEVLELQNMIGGEFVAPSDGKTEDIINPATGDVIAHSPLSTEVDVDRAVKAARKAFETWQYTTPSERQALLLKLADAFQERADEITDWECPRCNRKLHGLAWQVCASCAADLGVCVVCGKRKEKK